MGFVSCSTIPEDLRSYCWQHSLRSNICRNPKGIEVQQCLTLHEPREGFFVIAVKESAVVAAGAVVPLWMKKEKPVGDLVIKV
jgi:hypothetical protein